MALALPVPEPPWPASLSPLKAVDDLLRCGICFDYFSIAMIIPQCSHNYCSLCIRKFLSYKTQCPTCCVAVSESDLKNNRTLDELVKSFNSAREQLFQLVLDTPLTASPLVCGRRSAGKSHVRSPVSQPVLKEGVPLIDSFLRKEKVCISTKADDLAGTDQKIFKTEEDHNPYSSSAEADGKDNEVESQESPECTKIHEKPSTSMVKVVKKVADTPEGCAAIQQDLDRPESWVERNLMKFNKVDCPVCEVAIPEQYINKHLDSCLTRDEKKESLRSSAHKRKPMSKVVYNLLSDRDLKKKLKEHGLSTHGTRHQLIRRHQEFVHMYNAQCDSLNPKSVAEVVKELETNEKIRVQLESNKTGETSLTFTKDQTEEEIDEIHTDYRNKHKSEFQFLMDQVNNRWKKSGKRKTESAQNKEVVAVQELSVTTAIIPGKAQIIKKEIPDGESESSSLEEDQRSGSPEFSLSSESTSSSSSDILRDVQGPGTRSPSSDKEQWRRLPAKGSCDNEMNMCLQCATILLHFWNGESSFGGQENDPTQDPSSVNGQSHVHCRRQEFSGFKS
ncbi:E3 ubiquitin-protein ligase RAD18 isoform X3 [Cuculus canorus]|uniref:E3 ubiquitin-protein ligase RAD18 isoform X3 n=1 Tax=Cuculus canorus TaxID=55661 RepID=UPI0023AAF47B|nr:E3 ubiquitin-protein ligase RAD18 isoform X3 [Cuculus canorus]